MQRPIVAVPACRKQINGNWTHTVGEKYLRAVTEAVGGSPLVLPAMPPGGGGLDPDRWLEMVDGLLLTGSPSNVHPEEYEGAAPREGVLADRERDGVTLPLIRAAIGRGVPLLAICRGIQELNAALGGTLHQHVEELPGRMNHRSPRIDDLEVKYAPAHGIDIADGGLLRRLWGKPAARVNSLHGQGIDRIAPGLFVEAIAPDGQVEAVSMPGARAFVFGAQWHPEHRALENPLSMAIFGAFADACRARQAERCGVPLRQAAE